MLTGKTSSGFEFSIPEGLANDFRFVKAYSKISNGMKNGDEEQGINGTVELVSVIFSNEAEEERLYKHLGQKYEGRVPINVLWAELNEIIIACKQDESLKN